MKRLETKWLLPVLILLYSMNFMDRSVLGIVGDTLKADLALTDGQLGLLHSILLATLIFLIIPGASISDILGRRKVLSAAAAIWTAAMAMTGTAASFVQLVWARALGGVNEATMGAGGTAWLATTYPPEKRGKVMGLYQMSAPLGMAIGTILGGVVLAWTGSWRATFFVFIIPGIVCAIAIPLLPNKQEPAAKGYFKAFPKLFKTKTILICGLAGGFYCITKFAYQTWLPVLLMRTYKDQVTPFMAGLIVGAFLLAGAVGPVLGGIFSDFMNKHSKSGRVYAVMIVMAIVLASKFALFYMIGKQSLPIIITYGVFDGMLTMMPTPIYFSITQDVADEKVRGGACGMLGMIIYLTGGAWGPLLIGFFSDFFGGGASGLRMAELVLLSFMVLSVIIYGFAIKTYARERKDIKA